MQKEIKPSSHQNIYYNYDPSIIKTLHAIYIQPLLKCRNLIKVLYVEVLTR